MLTNSESTLDEVYMAFKYINQKERLSLHYIKQHQLSKGEACEENECLPIIIIYEHYPSKKLSKDREIVCYISEDSLGAIDQNPTSSAKPSTSERYFDFTEIISVSAGSSLVIKKAINKS